MALILCLETATHVCSVCLARDGEMLTVRETSEPNSHSQVIGLFVQEVFDESGVKAADVDAVAVSSGPGSYTGLRIGVSMAKGLCYSAKKPLIAIPTLTALAQNKEGVEPGSMIIPMLDARRMEVYAAVFDQEGRELKKVEPVILDENSFARYLNAGRVVFRGDGAGKASGVIRHPGAVFQTGVLPSSKNMIPLAFKAFKENDFVDTAYFEPFYLKEFQAKVSKIKGLK